jgi:hypothetical protein
LLKIRIQDTFRKENLFVGPGLLNENENLLVSHKVRIKKHIVELINLVMQKFFIVMQNRFFSVKQKFFLVMEKKFSHAKKFNILLSRTVRRKFKKNSFQSHKSKVYISLVF